MEDQLISIILPLYNCGKYLRKCLDSLVSQTYKNLEIILINDGSSDETEMICLEYSAKYERFKYLTQSNQGVSTARNKGLDFAHGKWIVFIDGDDWVEENYIEMLLEAAEKYESDIVVSDYYEFRDREGDFLVHTFDDTKYHIFTNQQECFEFAYHEYYRLMSFTSPWCKLISRDLIGKTRFPSYIKMAEDADFMTRLYLKTDKVVYFNKPLYIQRRHENSATANMTEEKIRDEFLVSQARITLFAICGLDLHQQLVNYELKLRDYINQMKNDLNLEHTELYNNLVDTLNLIEMRKSFLE